MNDLASATLPLLLSQSHAVTAVVSREQFVTADQALPHHWALTQVTLSSWHSVASGLRTARVSAIASASLAGELLVRLTPRSSSSCNNAPKALDEALEAHNAAMAVLACRAVALPTAFVDAQVTADGAVLRHSCAIVVFTLASILQVQDGIVYLRTALALTLYKKYLLPTHMTAAYLPFAHDGYASFERALGRL